MRWPAGGLRSALIILVIGAVCIPALALAGWLAWLASQRAMVQAQAQVNEKASMMAAAIVGRISAPVHALLWMTSAPTIRSTMLGVARPLDLQAALKLFLEQWPEVMRIALYNQDGKLVQGIDRENRALPEDASRSPWFVGAIHELAISGGFAPVHIFYQPATDQRASSSLIYACTLLHTDNVVAGILILEADIPTLVGSLCGPGRTLHDIDGNLLAGQLPTGEAIAASSAVRMPGQPAVHWQCTMAVPRKEALATVYDALRGVAIAAILAVLIATPTALLLARRLLQPLQQLERSVRTLREHGIATPLPPVDGPEEITAIASAIENLRSSLREQTERLLETNERLRIVADFAADWELWLAPDQRILHCSPSCQRLAGHPPEHFFADAENFWRLIDPQDLPKVRNDFAASTAESATIGQWRLRRGDGSERWIEHMIRRVQGSDGSDRGWRVTLRDITERRAMEEQLRHEQRVQLLGRLAGGIAHDVNNLLAVISSQAELLRRHPEQTDRLDRIVNAVERGAALTRQLLMLSRRQVGGQTPSNLGHVVRETVDMLRRTWGSGKVDIAVELGEKPLWARINRAEFGQVLMNLLVNARDAMPQGGVITVRGSVQQDADGREWCDIAVIDQGIGMDAATMARIFDPYFTTKEHGKGTGLGLSIVQALVENSGGKIKVTSEPGKGSVFTIHLPACPPESHTPSDALPAQSGELRGLSVLVADDNRSQVELITDLLEGLGAMVRVARDGQEAVSIAERIVSLDLVIIDIQMPGMNGVQAAWAIRRYHPRAPILFITGYANIDRSEWSLPSRSEVLIKPFDARRLVLAVLALRQQTGTA